MVIVGGIFCFAVGGDGTISSGMTLGLLLRQYNSAIKGLSTGKGNIDSGGANLNLAVTGAITQGGGQTPSEGENSVMAAFATEFLCSCPADLLSQVENLIKRLRATSNINYDKDWKVSPDVRGRAKHSLIHSQMVSILVGHNNLCDYCDDVETNGPATFGRLVEEAVDLLQKEVPRLFVNLIAPIDVSVLYEASQGNSLPLAALPSTR